MLEMMYDVLMTLISFSNEAQRVKNKYVLEGDLANQISRIVFSLHFFCRRVIFFCRAMYQLSKYD